MTTDHEVMHPKKAKAKKPVDKLNGKFNRKKLAKDMLNKRTKEDLGTRTAAKQAGINYQTFNNVEFGKDCKPETLGKLCNWLGVQVQNYF